MLSRTIPAPLTWYPLELPFTLKLLEAYVSEIESHVELGITEFRRGDGTEILEVNDESGDTVAVHKGIHSGLWDLRSVFEGYMPNLQRRSALITLFSFLESELDRLCDRVRVQEKSTLQVTDIAAKGILRATTYLAKVGGLSTIRNCSHWTEIKNIQSIRNLIVHSGGMIPDQHDGRRSKIIAYVASTPLLSGTESVMIELGYLAHCLKTFKAFFGEIHAQMQLRYGA